MESDLLIPDRSDLAVPGYDRSAVRVGIVHFGVGGFHRAHQAMYVDQLMNDGLALDWGICGVGVMPSDRAMADALLPQGGLYTLVLKHADGRLEPRIIGSIVGFLYAPDDPEAVLGRLCAEETRIVSLTITEGGYNFNQVTGDFEAGNAAVQADLHPGAAPTTVFGFVAEALARRRRAGLPAFTVMSCDNIQSNGDVARRAFTSFARLKDPGLADWMSSHVSFPNSMVDRITPVTTDDDRAELSRLFGVDDRWPVVCEPFTQWVLEDEFPQGRPPYEQAGVKLVDDVEPYELMKLRLLNAGHQGLGYFGYLLGHRYVHEAATDPRLAEFVRSYMDSEATPTLRPVPGVDLDEYKSLLIERFANPEIRDTLARLCAESSDRIPKWVLPVLRSNLSGRGPLSHTAAIVASWARYAQGVDEDGQDIHIVDRLAAEITALAGRYPAEPLALLGLQQLFGDLAGNAEFCELYGTLLACLNREGAGKTLDKLNTAGPARRFP